MLAALRRSVAVRSVVAVVSCLFAATTPAWADDDIDLSAYDVLPPDREWQRSIGLTEVADSDDGAGVTVAVLDTGVSRHPDLGSRVAARVDLTPDADGYDRY